MTRRRGTGVRDRGPLGARLRTYLLRAGSAIQNISGPPQGPAGASAAGLPHRLTSVGDLTMSERVVEVGQSWGSDIIGIVTGVGLYSALFFL
jgi:hypothetical protein